MSTQGDKLKLIADAIRAKEGSSDPIPANDFPARISAIQTGTDTSDATATAGDILEGKTAYGAAGKLIGTIPSKGEVDLTASGPTVTAPAGHYPAQVSKSVAAAEQATPAISVSSGGLITATAQQTEGYVPAGSKSATHQLTVQGAQIITPGTADQTIPASRYLTGTQTIQGDANLKEENIKSGVSIFGKLGTYEGEGGGIIYTKISDSDCEYVSTYSFQITLPSSVETGFKAAFIAVGFERSSTYSGSGIVLYNQEYYVGLSDPYNGMLVTDLYIDGGIAPFYWSASGRVITCDMGEEVRAPRDFYTMGSPYSFFVY